MKRNPRRLLQLLPALWVLAAASLASASKPAATTQPLPSGSVKTVRVGHAHMLGSSCSVGQAGPGLLMSNFIYPPDDRYYTLLMPSQCPACADSNSNSARLSNVHVQLFMQVPCSTSVSVSIVGAAGPDSCPAPDPNTVLCAAPDTLLIALATGTVDFVIPLPDSCKFTGKAFLSVTFNGFAASCADSLQKPKLVLAGPPCHFCHSLNDFGTGRVIDLCSPEDGIGGEPVMYVDVAQCYTPVLPHSWGQLKVRYR